MKFIRGLVQCRLCCSSLVLTSSHRLATIQIRWRDPDPQEANSPVSVFWPLALREILNTFCMFSKNMLSRIGAVHKSSAFLVLLPYIHRDIIESTFLQLCLRRRHQDRQLFVLDFWRNSHSASANQRMLYVPSYIYYLWRILNINRFRDARFSAFCWNNWKG